MGSQNSTKAQGHKGTKAQADSYYVRQQWDNWKATCHQPAVKTLGKNSTSAVRPGTMAETWHIQEVTDGRSDRERGEQET
ncbi:hypothetical protein MY11210_009446 [Beauveria gryllotalpidicola]